MKLKIYAIKCLKMNHIFFLAMNKQISEYQSNLHVQFDQTQKVENSTVKTIHVSLYIISNLLNARKSK